MTHRELIAGLASLPETRRMPTLFVGHGSPMNGIEDNSFSRGWAMLGKELPRPSAVLSVSAHWLSRGTEVHIAEHPRIIHDFWGFPKELYELTYPAPGAPDCAKAIGEMVKMTKVTGDLDWGLDHGTWIVLKKMYPLADVSVFQLSIDMTQSHKFHYQLGRELAPLRRRGVLIIGSGNLVHNLGEIDFNENAKSFPWAEDFDSIAKGLIAKRDHTALIGYEKLGHAALLSIPTPDHFWPLLYILGLQEEDEGVSFPIEGLAHGSISMRSVLIK